jgi:hypothetical protein
LSWRYRRDEKKDASQAGDLKKEKADLDRGFHGSGSCVSGIVGD